MPVNRENGISPELYKASRQILPTCMSRPSIVSENNAQRSNKIIDFVNAPMLPAYPGSLSSQMYEDPYLLQSPYSNYATYPMSGPLSAPMLGAQAGMPYMPPAPSIPIGSVYPGAASPGFMPGMTPPRHMQQFHTIDAPVQCQPAAPVTPTISSRITEDELDHKINSQINSIMAAHKAEALCSKVEKLTDKVQKLSRNMEISQSSPPEVSSRSEFSPPPVHSRYAPSHSIESSASSHDNEISSRLRRLAAESNRRVSSRSFDPDF